MEAREKLIFPFSAIVGQEKAKLALQCVAVNPLIGGVLLRGDKGTGKSTMVRALANVLPEIEVVADCPFNCNPVDPLEMCDSCYKRRENEESLPVTRRRMKVVDLPLSVTIDRLVGSIDIEKFLKEGVRALQPGILAEANRNILYIDEVNLLDDYIADSLLDSAAMGWNTIEREGVSFRHPARFILVGSMNPEEGELRPQILDRFGLCVEVNAPMNPDERIEIVKRVEEFHADPLKFYKKFESKERELTQKIMNARKLLPKVEIGDELMKLLTETVIELGIKTNRAEIATIKTAKAIAALSGRKRVSLEDLEKAMELALPHRLRDKPFQSPHKQPRAGKDPKGGEKERKGKNHEGGGSGGRGGGTGNSQQKFRSEEVKISNLDNFHKKLKFEGCKSSRDSFITVVNFPKGNPVSYTLPRGEIRDLDLYSSALWAAMRCGNPPVRIAPDDVRVRVRRAHAPVLWVLILDSSGSMAIQKRISIAKGIAEELVERGYVKKAKLALIVARGEYAETVVPPTKNYHKVLECIDDVPTGGKTPLSSALHNLVLMSRRERAKEKFLRVRAFLITDGKANVPLFNKKLKDEIIYLARQIRKTDIEMIVYDTRPRGDIGLSFVPILEEIGGATVYRDLQF